MKMELNKFNLTIIASVGVGSLLGIYFYKQYKYQKKRLLYPKDVVILHQFGRGWKAPSASPFCLKLETWLRMAKIPYMNELNSDFSNKSKMPWITYNGVDIADSQFVIEYLSRKLNVNLDKDLTPYQKGVSRAVLKLTEESLKWTMSLHRVIYSGDPKECGLSPLAIFFIGHNVAKATEGQGYGRHTREEVYTIGMDDLRAIDDLIDDNEFLHGDKPSNVDASIFGIIAQIQYHDKGPLNNYLNEYCPNILRLMENVKETFWTDWEDHIIYKGTNL